MATTEVWRSQIVELGTADLHARSSKELCVLFAVEFIRVIDAMTWAWLQRSKNDQFRVLKVIHFLV